MTDENRVNNPTIRDAIDLVDKAESLRLSGKYYQALASMESAGQLIAKIKKLFSDDELQDLRMQFKLFNTQCLKKS